MTQAVDLTPYLRRILELIPSDRRDEYFEIVGDMCAKSRPDRSQHPTRKRFLSVPFLRRQRRQANALIKFSESVDRPLSTAPKGETKAEGRVRILEDVLKRFKLAHTAGMVTAKVRTYWLEQDIEAELTTARRQVRFERGDY